MRIALLLAFFVSACQSGDAGPAPPPPPSVEVVEVVKQDVPIRAEWIATLDGYVNAQIQPQVSGYDFSDLSYQEKQASGTTAVVFALSFIFVFLILAALYESWSLPFSVLLSVPVAVLGAFLGLYLRNFDLGVFAQIGLAMLIGLAAKNAILIVEFARDEMKKGKPLVDAALEGARLRLRPILMTSFALIFGLMPLWVASGSGAIARRILGTVVISGMLSATVVGIFIIPVLFVLVERLATRRHRRRVTPPATWTGAP